MKNRKAGKWLGMLFCSALLSAAAAIPAFADTSYGAYLVNESDPEFELSDKVVHFNGFDWYIIADDSTAADEGTVTLFAKDPIGEASKFDEDSSNVYGGSTVKGVLDQMTASGGTFANVADAIAGVDLEDVSVTGAKLWLLSKDEAGAINGFVRKCSPAAADFWWLRTAGTTDAGLVCGVDLSNGFITTSLDPYIPYCVRPALKLDLSKVTFDSTTKTFTAPIFYPLWVGGVQVTSAKYSGENWYYNADTKTLRLNGTIEGSGEFDDGAGAFDCGIYSNIPDLTINVVTHSTVRGSGTKAYSYGIRAGIKGDHSLTITGPGSLTVEGGSGDSNGGAQGYSVGIRAGSITLDGKLDAIGGRSQHEGASFGVDTGEIKGKGELTAVGNDYGIYSINEGLTIDGVTVTGRGGRCGIYLGSSTSSNSFITIKKGSSVVAFGTEAGISGNVKNEVTGAGWTDMEGTEGKVRIAVSTEGQSLTDYKRVQFPTEGTYPLWVGDTQVTEANIDDILGDGGKAKFDPDTNTLTLNNPEIKAPSPKSPKCYIYSELDKPLVIEGTADLTGLGNKVNAGIGTYGSDLELNGDFTIEGDYHGITTSNKKLTVSGGNVTVKATIALNGGEFSITDGTLTADGKTSFIMNNGITIGEGLSIVEPDGGKVMEMTEGGYWTIVDAEGKRATHVVIMKPHVHSLVLVKAKEATCTEKGNSEYYTCGECGLWFEDAAGAVEITNKSSIETPALGHNWGAWKQTKAPTATQEGEETRSCSRCGEEEIRSIPASGRRSSSSSGSDSDSSSVGNAEQLIDASGKTHNLGSGTVQGKWKQSADGSWQFEKTDGTPATGWNFLYYNNRADWYFFDAKGTMQTGWLVWNGSRYYLNPVSDGHKGAMLTGWQEIDGKWYYFETVSGQDQGHLYVNTRTPDGYWVGADGAWDGRPKESGR